MSRSCDRSRFRTFSRLRYYIVADLHQDRPHIEARSIIAQTVFSTSKTSSVVNAGDHSLGDFSEQLFP